MADDNSCLFHAVAFLVAEGASPASLRAAIVEQVRADPIMWNEGTLGKPVDEYCAWISDSRRWGGQVELAIFAEKYGVACDTPLPPFGYALDSIQAACPKSCQACTAEERLMLAPPEQNLDTSEWREQEQEAPAEISEAQGDPALEAFRRSLEGLL